MNIESLVEKTLFASRWLLCPLYIGLAFLLLLFSIHFFRDSSISQSALFLLQRPIWSSKR